MLFLDNELKNHLNFSKRLIVRIIRSILEKRRMNTSQDPNESLKILPPQVQTIRIVEIKIGVYVRAELM